MFKAPDFLQLQQWIDRSTENDVRRALDRESADIHDLAALLSPQAEKYLPQMAAKSSQITLQRFGHITQLYAPLYLSNLCINRCAYCGFSAGNKIQRRTLTLDEAEQEAMILHDRGFRHILLVTGEAPKGVGVDYLEELALRLRDRFAALSIEVQPLEQNEYERLFKAGITAVAVYQETYDRTVYKQVHLAGKKCDYDYRLDTPARAAAAGMREIGIGSLLGLADWRSEGLALALHLQWLRKQFWRTSFTISFPRLRPAAGEFQPLVPVSERNFDSATAWSAWARPDIPPAPAQRRAAIPTQNSRVSNSVSATTEIFLK
jgi:2-iminoacetate synthase